LTGLSLGLYTNGKFAQK